MTSNIPADVERLADHIAEYLTSNPHAADTVAGIQNWWLSGAPPGVSRGAVESAVRLLVRRGTLECRTLPDGSRIYARAPVVAEGARY